MGLSEQTEFLGQLTCVTHTSPLALIEQVHMFDGFALIAKLRVQGGRVWGSQRYVQSEAYL